ncbi:RluA family pseudouridine synthase [bacterium]|nr:RluA family pseudouridine synthase [bacterium]
MDSTEREQEIRVPPEAEGQRLDRFIHERLPEYSRAFIQKMIREEAILVDGKKCKTGLPLKSGQRVLVNIPEPEIMKLTPENAPIDIIYEDDHLAVVDKPAGLVVHPSAGHGTGTLVHLLLHHLDSLSGIGGVQRPGIVHRLDKDTSGLILVAKNDLAHWRLSEMLAAREIRREYLALVWGELPQKEGIIQGNIGRDPRHRQRMAVLEEGGKEASTGYRRLNHFLEFDYIRLALKTGRTHQIRVHLNSIGHPVLGDPLYGGRRRKTGGLLRADRERVKEMLVILQRQALHAASLVFPHPAENREMVFESPLPDDFARVLEILTESTNRSKETS